MLIESFPVTKPLEEFEHLPDPAIYRIDGGAHPWGDYGSILIHGMSAHLDRMGGESGPLQYERTGPFVPPITFPGIYDVIVTDAMKRAMEDAGFRGISFQAVILAHITEVAWHTWDFTSDEPEFYPVEGEPEGYILDQEHDPRLAQQMGPLWEVLTQGNAGTEFDMFNVQGTRQKHVSGRARFWFLKYFSPWTSFEPGR